MRSITCHMLTELHLSDSRFFYLIPVVQTTRLSDARPMNKYVEICSVNVLKHISESRSHL